jgi:hypothetical protein
MNDISFNSLPTNSEEVAGEAVRLRRFALGHLTDGVPNLLCGEYRVRRDPAFANLLCGEYRVRRDLAFAVVDAPKRSRECGAVDPSLLCGSVPGRFFFFPKLNAPKFCFTREG